VSVGIWFPTFWRIAVLLQCQELTAQWHSNISQKNRNVSHTDVTSKCAWVLLFENCFITPVTSLVHQRPSAQVCNSKDGTYRKSTWNVSWTALCTSEEGNGMTVTLTMHQQRSGRILSHLSALKCTTHHGKCLDILVR
jgi:hypothetical protein